jgi:folate-binding Fe-S cluster repair protein YgfZ
MNKQFKPIIEIDKELHQTILKDITNSIVTMIKNTKMLDVKEQINFINVIREKNKFDILAKMNKKTREEKDTEKELKKYGLRFKEEDITDDEVKPEVNKEIDEDAEEIDGEAEYDIEEEDREGDDLYMNRLEYGFFYT